MVTPSFDYRFTFYRSSRSFLCSHTSRSSGFSESQKAQPYARAKTGASGLIRCDDQGFLLRLDELMWGNSPGVPGPQDTPETPDQPRRSEHEAHLELEHPRRIDVGERRDRVGGGAHGDELTERRVRRAGVAVDRLPAAEVVAVIEEVEALHPEQDRAGLRRILMRPSTKIATSCVAVPRNADLAMTLPSMTGRSLFAPSPLLSMPVVALNGRADASCVTVPAVMLYGNW